MEHITLSVEVAAALASGQPVVALESTIISHGLPRPDNLELARALEAMVRDAGAVPATIAVLDGVVRIGLAPDDLERLAADPDIGKLSVRDLAPAIAAGISGATTVAATAHLAARAGIEVFATGGLGGVHPAPRPAGAQWDVSADLDTLARTPIAVVCSGVKSLLDVPATLERLETLGVAVVGYGTDDFPGFYVRRTGLRAPWRVDSPAQAAALLRARTALGVPAAVIVANPVPGPAELDPTLHDAALHQALTAADTEGVRGPDLTPFLLAALASATDGAAVAANVALAESNAELAARIAVELA
ncbi:MAG TPA: pseudouridine-5'-phosphate glycosidase [Sporichthyaceae bacterium]|nr:pseudouridine-5'-phosphate glycosidase [Sporichthyaceae bacterium]